MSCNADRKHLSSILFPRKLCNVIMPHTNIMNVEAYMKLERINALRIALPDTIEK